MKKFLALFLMTLVSGIFLYTGCKAEVEEPVTLKSVEVQSPSKTTYYVGEKLDTSGLKIILNYSNGTKKEVKDYKVSGFDSREAVEEQTVFVIFKEGGLSQTASFEVTIIENYILGIYIEHLPAKTVYKVDEAFNPEKLEVSAIYATEIKKQ